ncbi:MAG: YeiH family protein [Proteobacteria bacterium]|nr:YeiH family protein [Pseudomonadota bacterium]
MANKIYGILLVALFATMATAIAQVPNIKALAVSPLVIGIVLGIIFANTLRNTIPNSWGTGILFSAKTLLRIAIVFYGFKITFQQIASIGLQGLSLSIIMLSSTMIIGAIVGIKLLKLDKHTAILIASGSAVCGAAAVLATEEVLKSEPHKTAIAVGTVVLFGTISMFLYPILFKMGILNMDYTQFGLYIGSSIHEVAQVVAAGGAINDISSDTALIVKMTRIMLIAPMLLILGLFIANTRNAITNKKSKLVVPWFAVLFIAVAGFNSLQLLPVTLVTQINHADTFLLTMAMTALGMETQVSKFKQAGLKPLLLALVLFVWLVTAGYFLTLSIA